MSSRNSYFTVLVVLFLATVVALLLFVRDMQAKLVRTATLENAKLSTKAIEEFRTLYSQDVVQKVQDQGIEITHDYHGKPGAIPLPATMSMELGRRMGENLDGAKTRLYSKFPFPWREAEGGLRDDFQQQAWQKLSEDPATPHYSFTSLEGRPVLRYAVADSMRESCVSCHNNHKDTPKNDWKAGDLRGVLEVVQPMDNVLALQQKGDTHTLFASVIVLISGLIFLYFLNARHSRDLKRVEDQLIANSKMASLGKMAAGIAHEINQPLGAVLFNSETSIKLLQKENYEKAKELCETNVRQIERATKIISALRVFSREATMDEKDFCRLSDIVENVKDIVSGQLETAEIELMTTVDRTLPPVFANRISLEQVLANLLVNAHDALLESAVKKINVSAHESPGEIVIEVNDTGQGISADDLPHIFEPFFTTKKIGKGTGLGLSISYGIMKDNGGELRVNSKVSEGTTFSMVFFKDESETR